MQRRQIAYLIVSMFFIILILGGVGVFNYLERNLAKILDETILEIDLSLSADGTYGGTFNVFPIAASVEVSIKDGQITSIKLLKHSHGQGSAAEDIPNRVIEAQSLAIDTIAGATYSSKVILKAIEDALFKSTNQ